LGKKHLTNTLNQNITFSVKRRFLTEDSELSS
jgi:hypothetical protein